MFKLNNNARLMNDLQTIVSTVEPNIDLKRLSERMEEVLYNYNIERKEDKDSENLNLSEYDFKIEIEK